MTSAQQEARTQRPARDRRSKLLITAAELAVVVVLVAAVSFGLLSATKNSQGEEHAVRDIGLPMKLAGLMLEQAQQGGETLQALDAMHGVAIRLVDARMGMYEKNAMVWIGVTSTPEDAAALTDQMTKRIREGASAAFAYSGQVQRGQAIVHQVRAGGQNHFYYQKGSEVIWVEAPAGATAQFMDQALQAIP